MLFPDLATMLYAPALRVTSKVVVSPDVTRLVAVTEMRGSTVETSFTEDSGFDVPSRTETVRLLAPAVIGIGVVRLRVLVEEVDPDTLTVSVKLLTGPIKRIVKVVSEAVAGRRISALPPEQQDGKLRR